MQASRGQPSTQWIWWPQAPSILWLRHPLPLRCPCWIICSQLAQGKSKEEKVSRRFLQVGPGSGVNTPTFISLARIQTRPHLPAEEAGGGVGPGKKKGSLANTRHSCHREVPSWVCSPSSDSCLGSQLLEQGRRWSY